MERVEGIEPSRSAWKAEVLPLNYTRINWFTSMYKLYLEAAPRFELGSKGFADLCLTTWLCRLNYYLFYFY